MPDALIALERAFIGVELTSHKSTGKLISISGTDGSGKTTTLRILKRYLEMQGTPVRVLKLPSQGAKSLSYFELYRRDPLGSVREHKVDIFSLCLTTLGDRLLTIKTTVLPLLKRGVVVLVDRYLFSVLTEYLIHENIIDKELEIVRQIVSLFPAPDLAIFTSAPAEKIIERLAARQEESHVDSNIELLERRNRAFAALCEAFGGKHIETDVRVSLVLDRILRELSPHIGQKRFNHGTA